MSASDHILKIDFKKCVKAGECYYNHPDLFEAAESAYPTLLVERLFSETDVTKARDAVEVCPSGAISLDKG
jgi:ferredoxin